MRLHIFTHFMEALRECERLISRNRTVREIKAPAKTFRAQGGQIKLAWIPGRSDVTGNKRDVLQGRIRPAAQTDKPVPPDPAVKIACSCTATMGRLTPRFWYSR